MEGLLTESAKQILATGIVGAMLIVLSIVAGLTIRFLYKQCELERARSREDQKTFVALAEKMIAQIDMQNRGAEERTEVVKNLSNNIALQAAAFKAFADLQGVHFDRMLDLLRSRAVS